MVSVGSLLNGGFALLRTHPKAVAIWAGLYLVFGIAMIFATRPFMDSVMAMQQAQRAGAPPQLSTLPGGIGLLILAYLMLLVALVAVFAAAVRATASNGDDAVGFLRVGMDELRLLGLGVIFVVGLFMAEIVVVLVVALAAGVGFAAGPMVGGAIGVVLGLAAVCAVIWLQVRLSLTGAMTVLRHKIIIGDAWRATRGHFWTLFGPTRS